MLSVSDKDILRLTIVALDCDVDPVVDRSAIVEIKQDAQ
jgi:hypothetical protein